MKRIVPECYADTYLVQVLLKRDWPMHQHGINKVIKTSGELLKLYPKVAAVIDEDKNKKDFLQSLRLESDKNGITHKSNGHIHYFIIKPAIEKFILKCCKDVSIDITEFDFPINFYDLRNIFKSPSIEGDHNFKRLINQLVDKKSLGIIRLQSLLIDLIEGRL